MKFSEMHMRDPFILPYDNKYYLYCQLGKYAWNGCDGFYYSVSEDLENWSEPKKCFDPPKGFWSTNNYWAPEVHIYQGRFYLFASFIAEGHMRAVQILGSDTPEGPFTVHSCPITPNDWMCLDGTFYCENGVPYMVFCHEWIQTFDGEMCLVQLSDDLKTPVGAPQVLFSASQSGWAQRIDCGKSGYVTDGPFIYQCKDGKLLMTWSSEHDGYAVGVAVSESGKIAGPWRHCQTLLSKINGGHGMIFEAFDGQKYFTMHSPNEPHGAERPCIVKLKEIGTEPFLALEREE